MRSLFLFEMHFLELIIFVIGINIMQIGETTVALVHVNGNELG